jgi:hypothetical protein
MSDKLTEMWAAFEAHKPDASYADAWATMCKERTEAAMRAAYYAAPKRSAVQAAALDAAAATMLAEAAFMVLADRHAQEAINAIKREVKP